MGRHRDELRKMPNCVVFICMWNDRQICFSLTCPEHHLKVYGILGGTRLQSRHVIYSLGNLLKQMDAGAAVDIS